MASNQGGECRHKLKEAGELLLELQKGLKRIEEEDGSVQPMNKNDDDDNNNDPNKTDKGRKR